MTTAQSITINEQTVEAAARAMARHIEGGTDKDEAKWFSYAHAARLALDAAVAVTEQS
jgi:hypothetical protein